MEEEDETSLDDILDELDRDFGRREQERKKKSGGSRVYINVYDMTKLNEYTSRFGIGAFHSGIHVYDREYAYGGHPYSYTGIYDMLPQQISEIGGQGVQFRESIYMGFTSLSEEDVKHLVHSLGSKYNGNTYHVLNKNCNHFSSDLCQKICGSRVPDWVNRLAYVSSWMPFLLKCIPPSWITPTEDGATGGGPLCSFSSCSRSQSLAPPPPAPESD